MEEIIKPQRYLERMSRSLQEKMKIVEHFPSEAKDIVDVGCADGTVTLAMAQLFPVKKFLGIDLQQEFIDKAVQQGESQPNARFERVYLRDLLARTERFDIVVFCSVLHEFYSYGQGMSSVMKALADAWELLRPKGVIVIRDMVLTDSVKELGSDKEVVRKIRSRKDLEPYLSDFEKRFGKIDKVDCLNHFLLKYLYTDNWEHEIKEDYIPVTREQYKQIFSLLGMTVTYEEYYLIPYLKGRWMEDFGLTAEETAAFRSTGIIVASKK